MYSAGKTGRQQKFLEPLIPIPTQSDKDSSFSRSVMRRSFRANKSSSSDQGDPLERLSSSGPMTSSSARLSTQKSVDNSTSDQSPLKETSRVQGSKKKPFSSPKMKKSASFEGPAFIETDFLSNTQKNRASGLSNSGKLNRSASAPRKLDQMENSTEHKENVGDLLLESYTSAQFRVEKNRKPKRVRSVDSALSKTRQKTSSAFKVGPCKCKGCMIKREEEEQKLSKTSPVTMSDNSIIDRNTKSKEPNQIKSEPKQAKKIKEKKKMTPTTIRLAAKPGATDSGQRRKLKKPPSQSLRRGNRSRTPSPEKRLTKPRSNSSGSKTGSDNKPQKKKKNSNKTSVEPEAQSVLDVSADSGINGSIRGSLSDTNRQSSQEIPEENPTLTTATVAAVVGEVDLDEGFRDHSDSSSYEEYNFEEIYTARKPTDQPPIVDPNCLDLASLGLERSGTETTCCSSILFEEMKDSLRDDLTLTPRMLEFMDENATLKSPGLAEEASTINPDREVINSRMGSRMDNTPGHVMKWKRGPMLGRGAFGTVWCGLTMTGEMVAVKQAEISIGDLGRAQKEYEKLQGEVELLKSLRHRNIVGYLGTSLDGRTVSIFMQYIPGGSVYSILKKFGPLAEQVCARYTVQILDGVCYLHAKNVTHRDIKGSNLMLMPTGVIKLIDFGCAKRALSLSKSNSDILMSMKGTPFWMSPEVINGTGHGTKSDIWSIGCTFYEMANAKPPWSHMNKYQALCAISSGSGVPKLGERFSYEAQNFLLSCLTRDPDSRSPASHLIQHPLFVKYASQDSSNAIHDCHGIPRRKSGRRKISKSVNV